MNITTLATALSTVFGNTLTSATSVYAKNGSTNGLISTSNLASVLGVGAINETAISSGSDLNSYTYAGDYYCNGGAGSMNGIPSTAIAAFRLEVRSTNGSGSASTRRVYQLLHAHNSTDTYKRYYNGSSWTPWYKFNTTAV